jgi:hypothetical protein
MLENIQHIEKGRTIAAVFIRGESENLFNHNKSKE